MAAQPGSSNAALGWIAAAILGTVALGQCVGGKDGSPSPAATPTAAATVVSRHVIARALNCRTEPLACLSRRRVLRQRRRRRRCRGCQWLVADRGRELLGRVALPVGRRGVERRHGGSVGHARLCRCGAASGRRNPPHSGGASTGAQRQSFIGSGSAASRIRSGSTRSHTRKSRAGRKARSYDSGGSSCPCSGRNICIGPRGGRYCITSGGNKRYGV